MTSYMDENQVPQSPSTRQRIRDAQGDTETGNLFDGPAPAVNSPTSKGAAASLDIDTRAQRLLTVHNVITASGANGLTRQEVAERMNIPVNYITSSIDRLLSPLHEIIETTRRRVNPMSGKAGLVLIDKRFRNQQPKDAA